jgi:hypothetical protein
MNVSQRNPTGSKPLSAVPGLGSIAARTFADYGVKNLLDLARLDPYDERFTKLGEGFPRWVLYARSALADEIIKGIDVNSAEIRVGVLRNYDQDVSVKAVMGRLGVYYIYVDVSVVEGPSGYTISISPKSEFVGSAQWNEYRANASLFASRSQSKEQGRPQVADLRRAKWRNFRDFESELLDALKERKDVQLLFRVFVKSLLCERLNTLVIWGEDSANRTTVRHMLSKLSPHLVHITMGGNRPEKWVEAAKHLKRGSILFLDEVERADPFERQAMLDILAARKFYPAPGESAVEIESNVMINVWYRKEAEILDPDVLGLINVPIKMPKSGSGASWVGFVEKVSESDSDGLFRLTVDILNRPLPAPDQSIKRPVAPIFKASEFLPGLGASLPAGLERLAEGIARSKYKEKIEPEDFKEANSLMQECLRSVASR